MELSLEELREHSIKAAVICEIIAQKTIGAKQRVWMLKKQEWNNRVRTMDAQRYCFDIPNRPVCSAITQDKPE